MKSLFATISASLIGFIVGLITCRAVYLSIVFIIWYMDGSPFWFWTIDPTQHMIIRTISTFGLIVPWYFTYRLVKTHFVRLFGTEDI